MKEKKLVFAVGINDADYPVTRNEEIEGKLKQVWICPFYVKWRSMIGRCYSKKLMKFRPTYDGCQTVPEWHYFMTFRAWMVQQDWQGKDLDKDLLFPGNKIYGPDTCVFISRALNNFINDRPGSRSKYPVGVTFQKQSGKFESRCSNGNTKTYFYLGAFDTPEEAHQAWLDKKIEMAYHLGSQHKDSRVLDSLVDRYKNYHKYFGELN